MTNIAERVSDVLAKTLGMEVSDCHLEANLRDDLSMDSLSAVEVAMALEDEFEIEDIPAEKMDKAVSVADIVAYVQKTGGTKI